MLKEEFEKISGIEVSDYNYKNIVEPMYMAVNLDKKDFIKLLNLKALAEKSGRKNLKYLYDKFMKKAKEYNKKCFYCCDYNIENDIEDIMLTIRNRYDKDYYFEKIMKNGVFYYESLVINGHRYYVV